MTSEQRRIQNLAVRRLQSLRRQFASRPMLTPSSKSTVSFDPEPVASRDKTAKIQGGGW